MSFQDLSDSRRPTANDRILGDPEGRGGSIGRPVPDDPAPRDRAPGTPGTPVQTLQVYPAAQFCVTHGVNLDDPLSIAGELELEAIYALGKNARIGRLALAAGS
ncbi:MAG TPA: hypothetical protein ENK41_01130, partial [Rhodobacteraceae bacterium]|nr:hypothetical protein [Paracoccaceae bacterium]